MFQGMFNLMTVQPVVAMDRGVYYREHAAAMYSALPWTVATGAVEMPYLVVQVGARGAGTFAIICSMQSSVA